MSTASLVTIVIVVLVVLLVLLVLAIGYVLWQRRTARLRERFGPEYSRTVEESGGRRKAEADLREREKRHDRLELRPVSDEAARRYRADWDAIQRRFVDEPGGAVEEADVLVVRIMRDRGYPVDDFDQRADDVSVDHPEVAQHYRAAHGVAVEHQHGKAGTEQLRGAVTSYRSLVDALLEDGAGGQRRQ
ncbi:hypothetical protein A8924_5893 [Saccharopolyspora erythraea NRRL 2338]|uniref:Possible secreted protein n=2 Tax=Saccharopolyspora erythraea TaxID=1836 RepID=A4FL15_SACEN|nr:hypothetical protein [Saccharopolyspora erythraea]PFG98380.1 hypothetical protein A8924_5893 [Saccharopolyspora erythraea NRRL 2338]QRK88450.1 hypothetical protein JQX30_27850 [Saccharopolyspora erythraea]CAM04740.1 possible secreted protein [Saccharopolyspora erythraea NRRL 2338]